MSDKSPVERDLIRDQVETLRDSFDASFGAPRATLELGRRDRYLLLRVLGVDLLVAASDVAHVTRDVRVTPLPTAQPGLLGVAAVSGRMTVVHSLAFHFLNEPLDGIPPVLLTCRSSPRLAFAVDTLEDQVEPDEDAQAGASEDTLLLDGAPVRVCDLGVLARRITSTPGAAGDGTDP